jgi:ATP-binding protein involved in chromosome partitioning
MPPSRQPLKLRARPAPVPMAPAIERSPAKFVVAIASGKGGVGKSTVTVNLALALEELGRNVGVLDADFYGPDIPLMVGIKRTARLKHWQLWRHPDLGEIKYTPVERFGVKVMSVGFLLGEEQALLQPMDIVHFVARQLIVDVDWGELDYLLIDLPPGTADLQQRLVQLIPISGAVVIVTPQDVAHLDAKKALEMFRVAGVRVLGGVENMSSLVCPHCDHEVDVFPPVREDRSIWALGITKLASLPLDPGVARASDSGRPVVRDPGLARRGDLFRTLAATVEHALEPTGGTG